jgi:AAA family ATP:ADP antiporter
MAIGPRRLMVGAAATLLVCVLLARIVNRVSARDTTAKAAAADDKPLASGNGFAMIFADRYLLLIALLAVLINVVNTMGEYLLGRYIVDAALAAHPGDPAAREQFIGAAYSRLFSTVNLVGFLLQMFVVSRVFKFLGVGKSLFIHPIVALVGYLMMLRAPSITTIGYFKVADNSLDYSLGNTTKQALWLPTSREAKYKAKQAVDSFFVRMGDVIQAGVVFLGERLALAVPTFAAVTLALVAGWLGVVGLLNRQLRAKADQAGTQQL